MGNREKLQRFVKGRIPGIGSQERQLTPVEQLSKRLDEKIAGKQDIFGKAVVYVTEIEVSAQKFVDQDTPENFKNFLTPFLPQDEDSPITQYSNAEHEIDREWWEFVHDDKKLEALFGYRLPTIVYLQRLEDEIQKVGEEQQENRRNPLWAVRNRARLEAVRLLKEYVDVYKAKITPLEDKERSMKSAVDVVVHTVEQKLRDTRREREPSEVEKEVSKEGTLDALEERWLDIMVVQPLRKMEDVFVSRKKRENPDYSLAEQVADEAQFVELREEYIRRIRERISEEPKTRREWKGETGTSEASEQQYSIYDQFKQFGVEQEYTDMSLRLTDHTNENALNSYSFFEKEDKVIDLRPRQDYLRWIKLLENFDPEQPSWIPRELEEIIKDEEHSAPNYHYLSTLYYGALSRQRAEEKVDQLDAIPADKLRQTLPQSYDRWPVLKGYLAEKGIVSSEKMEAFEKRLINRLVEDVLIAGGNESWPGTGVTHDLRMMGTLSALEPLLYYQTLVSGASGLYKAGHTNAAAQNALEAILRNTSEEDIQSMQKPKFVNDALMTLKSIASTNIGDEYGRSYLTAGLVAQKFGSALGEIKENYENPEYKKWITALLRGMKNSRQPYSQETYDKIMDFMDFDKSPEIQSEVLQMYANRIHNREEMGMNTRINPDFSKALNAVDMITDRPDFQKSPQNMASLFHIMDELQEAADLSRFTEADITRIKLNAAMLFQRTIGIPDAEQTEVALYFKDRLNKKLAGWMEDENLPATARYMILQIFDITGFDYSRTVEDIEKLFSDQNLKKDTEGYRSVMTDGYIAMNFMKDINRGGLVECLTDLLMRRYGNYADIQAAQVIVREFIVHAELRKEMSEFFHHWDTTKYIKEHPAQMHALFDDFNEYVISGTQDERKAVLGMFSDRVTYENDEYLRDKIFEEFDLADEQDKGDYYDSVLRMVWSNNGFAAEEIPENYPKDSTDLYHFKHQTLVKATERMHYFLKSENPQEVYWALYSQNLFNTDDDEYRQAVERLHTMGDDLEQHIQGGKEFIDKLWQKITLKKFWEKEK